MGISTQIGMNIRRWREFKEVKQETLARQLGISKAALSLLENGKVGLTVGRLEQIALLLGLDPLQLFKDPKSVVEEKL